VCARDTRAPPAAVGHAARVATCEQPVARPLHCLSSRREVSLALSLALNAVLLPRASAQPCLVYAPTSLAPYDAFAESYDSLNDGGAAEAFGIPELRAALLSRVSTGRRRSGPPSLNAFSGLWRRAGAGRGHWYQPAALPRRPLAHRREIPRSAHASCRQLTAPAA
jgi:hypothetical protein